VHLYPLEHEVQLTIASQTVVIRFQSSCTPLTETNNESSCSALWIVLSYCNLCCGLFVLWLCLLKIIFVLNTGLFARVPIHLVQTSTPPHRACMPPPTSPCLSKMSSLAQITLHLCEVVIISIYICEIWQKKNHNLRGQLALNDLMSLFWFFSISEFF